MNNKIKSKNQKSESKLKSEFVSIFHLQFQFND